MHSSASFDCTTAPETLLREARRLGLDPVFITDHETISGANVIPRTNHSRVVVGEEILTKDGELIGLFLTQEIRSGLDPKVAAAQIKSQGGLVYLEHPYDMYRRHMSEESIEEIASLIDIVEVFNARADDKANQRAEDLCIALGAAPGAGSDAHRASELGSVYVEMEAFDGADDFLAKLRQARIVRRPSRLRMMLEARLPLRMPAR